METAAHPNYRHSLFHEMLFRCHILEEDLPINPGYPPYYDRSFFDLIKFHHQNSPLNVTVISVKQWYRLLLEQKVLMSPETDSEPQKLIPVRCEALHPESNWNYAWHLVKTPGLKSSTSSFLFKLLHLLLPTQDRVHRLGVNGSQSTRLCMVCRTEDDSLQHAFYRCPSTAVAGLTVLGWKWLQV